MNLFSQGIVVYLIMCLYASQIFSLGFLVKHTSSTDTLLPPFDSKTIPLLAVAKKANSRIGNLLFFLSAVFFIYGCVCLATGTSTGKTFTVLSTFLLIVGIGGFVWMLIYYLKRRIASI